MIKQYRTKAVPDIKLQLYSVASLQSKIDNGISVIELHGLAERKFDTLIGLLDNEFDDNIHLISEDYSLNDLKKLSLSVFSLLILNEHADPYMTLCISGKASLEEVKRRRNKLLHVFHPDRSWEHVHGGTFTVKINEAYQQILEMYSKLDMPQNEAKLNKLKSYSNRYCYEKRSYEKKIYLFIIIIISILAFIGLMKVILF